MVLPTKLNASTGIDEDHYASTINYLDRCVQVCERLVLRWTKSIPPDEPLGTLTATQIQALKDQVYNLRHECTNLDLTTLAAPLLATRIRLFETMDLIDFYRQEEHRGQDGALNTLFASRYILNYTKDFYGTPGVVSENRYVRMGKELGTIIKDLMQEPVQSAAQAVQNFERHRPTIEEFLQRVSEQNRPRYISKYPAAADVPFNQAAASPVYTGSFGAVRKVTHSRTRELLAMKTFCNVFTKRERKQILKEIGLLEVCSHKNIVRYVEAFCMEDDEYTIHLVIAPWAPYTLTKFLRTPDMIRKKQCPWFEHKNPKSHWPVYRIMHELSDALEYLHNHSIKHKDLKPDNILLYQEDNDDVTPMITDLGISKIYMQGAATRYTDSTYVYLAPEQHAEKESSPLSDIWQLGCCFAELLAVVVAGTSGYERLHDSFNREEENCSCSIALEHTHFMKALAAICMSGNAAQRRALEIISGMLESNPSRRLEIRLAKAALQNLAL
ncbi:kinase-like protein [Xylariaceae sp. AK1471]|nr:kinase-like protein [Xylariaceae sp. AK1471]